jgi:hypothetical protein
MNKWLFVSAMIASIGVIVAIIVKVISDAFFEHYTDPKIIEEQRERERRIDEWEAKIAEGDYLNERARLESIGSTTESDRSPDARNATP